MEKTYNVNPVVYKRAIMKNGIDEKDADRIVNMALERYPEELKEVRDEQTYMYLYDEDMNADRRWGYIFGCIDMLKSMQK